MNARALLLASCLLAGRAAAEPEPKPTLLRLSATSEELHARRTQERAARLEHLLSRLPEIERAHVELTLPNVADVPLDRPLPRPRALVVLERRGRGSEQDVAKSARSLLGEDVELTLIERAPPVERAPLVHVGPFAVAPTSSRALQATLVGLLTCNVLLAGSLVWRTRRDRPRGPKVDPGGRSSRPP